MPKLLFAGGVICYDFSVGIKVRLQKTIKLKKNKVNRMIVSSTIYHGLRQLFSVEPYDTMLENIMKFVRAGQLSGDYLEFGVYQGNSFISAFRHARKGKLHSMKFWAFDSFEGLPEIKGIDAEGFKQWVAGEFSCTLDDFQRRLKKAGVDQDRTIIVKGWYDEILNKDTKSRLKLKEAAVIWIDCDLYESTKYVLNFITDCIIDGTVLVFDDWFLFRGSPYRGEQRAFEEWLVSNPNITPIEYQRYGWHGISFILHHKE